MGKEYWSGGHTKHKLRYHIVWIPKYWKRILENLLAIGLEELLKQACEVNRWRIEELDLDAGHKACTLASLGLFAGVDLKKEKMKGK